MHQSQSRRQGLVLCTCAVMHAHMCLCCGHSQALQGSPGLASSVVLLLQHARHPSVTCRNATSLHSFFNWPLKWEQIWCCVYIKLLLRRVIQCPQDPIVQELVVNCSVQYSCIMLKCSISILTAFAGCKHVISGSITATSVLPNTWQCTALGRN